MTDNTKKRILVIGVPDMAYLGVDYLINSGFNIVGVIGPLKTHNTYYSFKSYIDSKHLNFLEYDRLSDADLHAKIRDLSPDIAVVFSFNNKIPKSVIDLIPDGILNLHPSLLPLYRGGNPYSRTIMNGEKESGVTIHFISENFDEGDIVAQVKCPIEDNETMGTLFTKTNYLGVRLMISVLSQYEKTGHINRTIQPQGDFVKAKNLTNDEYILDFNQPADAIERKVRALNPYLNCYTFYKGQILRIYKVAISDKKFNKNALNGEIVEIKNNNIYIKTSDGCIIPKVIQLGGLFVGDTEDFIKLSKPKVGDVLGNG